MLTLCCAQVSRQIYAEATPILYSRSAFRFEGEGFLDAIILLSEFDGDQ